MFRYQYTSRVVFYFDNFKNIVISVFDKIFEVQKEIILSEAVLNSNDWIMITDEDGYILFVNDAVCHISGYSKEELIGNKPSIFKSGLHSEEFYKDIWEKIKSGKIVETTIINKKKNDELFYVHHKIIPVKFQDRYHFVSIAKDITKEKELEAKLEKIRSTDSFVEVGNIYALIKAFLSLKDGFKYHKDNYIALLGIVIEEIDLLYVSYPYSTINSLLQELVDKLRRYCYIIDLEGFGNIVEIAKIGDDRFVILLKLINKKDINTVIENLEKLLRQPFDTLPIRLDYAIGAILLDSMSEILNFYDLYGKLSITLAYAKQEKKPQIYDKYMINKFMEFTRAKLIVEEALEENLFEFFYQPYFDINTTTLAGFESLIRIVKRENGNLKITPPYMFIDWLESSIYIEDFERWAIDTTIKQIVQWNLPSKGISLSLNLSAVNIVKNQFLEYLISRIYESDKKYGISKSLIIEITERNMAKENITDALQMIKKDTGIRFAIDDFGTGYSSFSRLKTLPIDEIKIDMSFVKNLDSEPKDRAITKSIVDMAKELSLDTISEGVENKTQFEILKSFGCNKAQGYLFAKPMPSEEAQRFII